MRLTNNEAQHILDILNDHVFRVEKQMQDNSQNETLVKALNGELIRARKLIKSYLLALKSK